MSNVLIVPEKNEGLTPLKVVEEGLKSGVIDEVLVIDGWSTDNTFDLLEEGLPKLSKKYGKNAEIHRAKLRNTGKGGAMVSGMEIALEKGHSNISFIDGDVTSVTSKWSELLVNGIKKYDADVARGYYDRSPFDAQITRHVTRPLINMFFPEGAGVNQPLGGELCMTRSFVEFLLNHRIKPPHTWGIDTFITVTALAEGFKTVEIYLSQKVHKRKTMDELKSMTLECFDEIAKLIYFYERNEAIPLPKGIRRVITIPKSELDTDKTAEDVRSVAYINLEDEINSFYKFVRGRGVSAKLFDELHIPKEDQNLILGLLNPGIDFKEKSKALTIKRWIHLLYRLTLGYIDQQFSGRYHDLIFNVWRLRSLAFCFNEVGSFEEAEMNTEKQAKYAFEFGQRVAREVNL